MTDRRSIAMVLAGALIAAGGLVACDPRDNVPRPKTNSPEATAPQAPRTVPSANRPAAGTTGISEGDRKFVAQAVSSGMAEVEITKHTMDKAASAEVQKMAAHLHKDHTHANQELLRIAAQKGMSVPSAPSDDKRAEIDKLLALRGADLDRAVIDKLAAAHRDSIKRYEQQAKDGADADLKAFAAKTAPTLREHLKMVEGIKAAAAEPAPPAAGK